MDNPQSSKVSIIVGQGEVGQGLFDVLAQAYGENVKIRDIQEPGWHQNNVDFLHICFPYKKANDFRKAVSQYRKQYNPRILVIHSTVPVGTTRKFGSRAIHSPIRGKHPDLANGIKTFVKYIGSVVPDLTTGNVPALELAEYFIGAGVKTHVFDRSETSELGKILETTQYGWFIILQKEIKKLTDRFGLDFTEVYRLHNEHYNQGYRELSQDKYARPILEDVQGPIGGHCVMENCDLLSSSLTKIIKKFNQELMKQTP